MKKLLFGVIYGILGLSISVFNIGSANANANFCASGYTFINIQTPIVGDIMKYSYSNPGRTIIADVGKFAYTKGYRGSVCYKQNINYTVILYDQIWNGSIFGGGLNSSAVWYNAYSYFFSYPNFIPTISSLTSTNTYINASNSGSFDFSVNGISDTDIGSNLNFNISVDGTNYASISNVTTTKNFIAGENLNKGDIVRKGIILGTELINGTSYGNAIVNHISGNFNTIGQTFVNSQGTQLNYIKIGIYNYGTPSGTMVLKLYTDQTKTTLLGTSQTYNASDSSVNSSNYFLFNYLNPIQIKPFTSYYYEVSFSSNSNHNGYNLVGFGLRAPVSGVSLYENGSKINGYELNYQISTTYFPYGENNTFIYKTDAKDINQIDGIGVVSSDTLSGSTTGIDTSGISDKFIGLTTNSTYYIGNTPGSITLIPGNNSKIFGISINSSTIQFANNYYNDVNANITSDFTGLSEGNNSIYVKSNDGIADSNVVLMSIVKDTIKPTLTEVTSISSLTNSNTPSYTFNSSEIGNITYSGACSSSTSSTVIGDNTVTLNTLSDGLYNNCSVKVTDSAGNVSMDLNIPNFTVDTVAPVDPTSITYNTGSTYSQSRDISLQITHSNELDVDKWCTLDSTENISTCSWGNTKPASYTFSSDGDKTMNIYLKDLAGNINTYSPANTILIDTIDPLITITQDVDVTYTNTGKIVTTTVVDTNLQGFLYEVVDNSLTCNADITYTNTYTSGNNIVLDNELYNGKKICFSAYDKAGRVSYASSSLIENIDMTNPNEPNFTNVYQSAWNKIKFKGTCTPETGLKFVVLDNGVEIARENLSNPCVIDFEYTLTNPPAIHNIKYFLEDQVGNKSLNINTTSYVDSSGILITPKGGKTVEPIITFFGYALPNTGVKIKDTIEGTYIATGNTDNNGIFYIQTTTSQSLGNLTFDLEVNGVLKNEGRTVTVASSSIIIPTIDESSVFSKYSGIKELFSFESQLISFKAKGEPLSKFKVYSYADVSGNRVITEIAEGQFSAGGEALVSSNVSLPGGENELIIIDTIHDVSSNIIYMVVADPFGTVYDSVTKTPLVGAEITFCKEGETTPAILPLLHGEVQPNPVTTDSKGNYFSYETVGQKYYICKVVKNGYKFPSTTVTLGSSNLDTTPNVGSHGQVFEILPTPLHIDIPMDKVITVKSSGGGGGMGGSSFYGILQAKSMERKYATVGKRQLMVLSLEGTETKERTYSNAFNGGVYSKNIYRVLYESGKKNKKRGIEVTKPLIIQITDLALNNFKVYIKYNEDEEYQLFTDYLINGTTISFKTDIGFELFIDNNVEVEGYKTNEELTKELESLNKYKVNYYTIDNIKEYILYITGIKNKYGSKIAKISDKKIFSLFPTILKKIDSIEEVKVPSKYKYIYNYFGRIYNNRYDNK